MPSERPWIFETMPRLDFSHLYAAFAELSSPEVKPKPLPVLGGIPMRWICDGCFAMSAGAEPPASWFTVGGSGVTVCMCGDCRERARGEKRSFSDISGRYADGPDPRGWADGRTRPDHGTGPDPAP